jgi:hypothetical protein
VVVLRAASPHEFFVVANETSAWQPLNDENYADGYTRCVGRDEERAKAILDLPTVQAALRHLF